MVFRQWLHSRCKSQNMILKKWKYDIWGLNYFMTKVEFVESTLAQLQIFVRKYD